MGAAVSALCRDCLTVFPRHANERCPACESPRVAAHPELHGLTIAHIDCDAFYASIEKRDDPSLTDRPVIVGGGRRGVVAAACYVARVYGVRSAMPMYKALEACPDAVVIRPDMAKYRAAGLEIRDLMRAVTPLVEPLSIDEAFLDLSAASLTQEEGPAQALARLVLRIERKVGVSASIGLSYNKFLAKVASDLDKPRGFAVIGRRDAAGFLAGKPVGIIWGVGQSLQTKLRRDGITAIEHLQALDEATLVSRYGSIGRRLHRFSRGEDHRTVDPHSDPKSISAETTFEADIDSPAALAQRLWPLCEKVGRALMRKQVAGRTVVLKLKRSDFQILTRSRRLPQPTQEAETLFAVGEELLQEAADGPAFRLIGIGAADLVDLAAEEAEPDLFGSL